MNFNNSQAGLVREGCLPSQYGPLPLDMQQGNEFVVPAEEKTVFDRRRQLLQRLSAAGPKGVSVNAKVYSEFETYSSGAFDLMTSPEDIGSSGITWRRPQALWSISARRCVCARSQPGSFRCRN